MPYGFKKIELSIKKFWRQAWNMCLLEMLIIGLSKERPILGDHPKAHIDEIRWISHEIWRISCEIHLQNL